MKTSELEGPALDWAVAKCEGITIPQEALERQRNGANRGYSPATDWAQGGPIIERERIRITTTLMDDDIEAWEARIDSIQSWLIGSTPLIAAMRCYVASKLGDTVEIPE